MPRSKGGGVSKVGGVPKGGGVSKGGGVLKKRHDMLVIVDQGNEVFN